MSHSKVKKITPVLPPDQRLKFKGVLKDRQLFWNASGRPIHFDFHDVDPTFMDGMLGEISEEFSGPYNVKVPQEVMYPEQFVYGEKHKHLNAEVKKLKLRTSSDFNRVNRFLEKLERVGIATDDGVNNMFRAVRIQLHCPASFTDDMLRHEIASYMIEIVDFLYPIMHDYLHKLGISFNTYVMAVYNGRIWADEYILGTIGKMFNIRISVISPFYSDIWNVYHDGRDKPDVVLITNGMDFGDCKYRISHFSATKGTSKTWKCVGHDIDLTDVGLYIGETDGRRTAVDLFNINENNNLLRSTRFAVEQINKLCVDVENICIDRDEILDELKGLKVKIHNFKRFTSYFVEDEYDDGIRKASTRNTMPPAKKVTEIGPSSSRAIPKIQIVDSRGTAFGQKLIDEAMEVLHDDSELLQVHSPIKARKMKSTEFDENLEEGEIREDDFEVPKVHSVIKKLKQKSTVSDPSGSQHTIDYQHHKERDDRVVSDEQNLQSNVHVTKKRKKDRGSFQELEKVLQIPKRLKQTPEDVLAKPTQQKRCRVKIPMIGRPKPSDIPPCLPSLGRYEKLIDENVEVENLQTRRIYRSSQPLESEEQITGIQLDRDDIELADILDLGEDLQLVDKLSGDDEVVDLQAHKRKHETEDRTSEELPKKSKILKLPKGVTIIPDDSVSATVTANILPVEVETVVEVPYEDVASETEIAAIHSYAKVIQKTGEAETDKDITVEQQQQHTQQQQQVAVKTEPQSSDSDDVFVTMVERGFPTKIKGEPTSSSGTGNLMKIMSTDSNDQEFQRRVQILADVHQSQRSGDQISIFSDDYIPQDVVEVETEASSGRGVTRRQEELRIKSEDQSAELDVFIPAAVGGVTKSMTSMVYRPRHRMKGKQTVNVQQTPDPAATATAGLPVPAVQQLDNRYYCDKCKNSFKDLKYFRRHMKRLCPYLTNPEMLKCSYCEKLFRHENRYLDHLSTHDGKLRRQCRQCGQRFAMENQLSRHRKLHCVQRKK